MFKNHKKPYRYKVVLLEHLSYPLFLSPKKAMAPHSSTLAWKIPWMEESGRLQSMGSLESDTTERLHFHFHALEKEMATPSSVLAWRIPGTGKPGGLPSMGSHRIGHDWSDLAAAAVEGLYCVAWDQHRAWHIHGKKGIISCRFLVLAFWFQFSQNKGP